ncbi:MAG: cytochrome c peroxidase [Pseudomonadota bacterium]
MTSIAASVLAVAIPVTLAVSAQPGAPASTPAGTTASTPAGTTASTLAATPASALPKALSDQDFIHDAAAPPAQVELGRMLFFDKILSGNRNISCATCHHPENATADAVALSLGEGAEGRGRDRKAHGAPVLGRVPRNAPALFNLGAREVETMFHDGRAQRITAPDGTITLKTPAGDQLPRGLDGILAAQALFPILSATEMAGHPGENPIADAAIVERFAGPGGAWDQIARRLAAIPAYVAMFRAAYPGTVATGADIHITHVANAIGAFEAQAFRATGSPFDAYLAQGEAAPLPAPARRGMELFYGKADCATCHAGPLQTDYGFHAIAMPQLGPGKDDGADTGYAEQTGFAHHVEDFGRYRVTEQEEDRYRFRTPSLRNVALTGPWGHAGAYDSLEAAIRHHLDPVSALEAFDAARVTLPPMSRVYDYAETGDGVPTDFTPVDGTRIEAYNSRDFWAMGDPTMRHALAAANELAPKDLTDREIADLVAFLATLTDPASRDMDGIEPDAVPSGLPLAD